MAMPPSSGMKIMRTLAMSHDAERSHVAELVQRNHRGQKDGKHQPDERQPEERPQDQRRQHGKTELRERPLEQAAALEGTGLGPLPQPRQLAPHGEEAEHQKGQAAIAVGAPQDDQACAVILGDRIVLPVVGPETDSERGIILDPHGVALPSATSDRRTLRSIGLLSRPSQDSFIRASAPPSAALPGSLRRQDFSRPAGIGAKRIERLPDAHARRGDTRLEHDRPDAERDRQQQEDDEEIEGDQSRHEDRRHAQTPLDARP